MVSSSEDVLAVMRRVEHLAASLKSEADVIWLSNLTAHVSEDKLARFKLVTDVATMTINELESALLSATSAQSKLQRAIRLLNE